MEVRTSLAPSSPVLQLNVLREELCSHDQGFENDLPYTSLTSIDWIDLDDCEDRELAGERCRQAGAADPRFSVYAVRLYSAEKDRNEARVLSCTSCGCGC